jgi:hypothetical protein
MINFAAPPFCRAGADSGVAVQIQLASRSPQRLRKSQEEVRIGQLPRHGLLASGQLEPAATHARISKAFRRLRRSTRP